ARLAGQGSFMAYLHQWATLNAFDDAFFLTAIMVLLGIVPALFLRNIVFKKKKSPDENIEIIEM
ncbi:MAG: hypothetical protein M1428_00630, partial [Deltaproteobacteria bacterium]|nr:hypothetical protein [Deltaproteobacteria bacterium]